MMSYKDDDVELWREFVKIAFYFCLIVVLIGTCLLLCGCGSTTGLLQPPAKYLPGENFGNGGETRCNTRQIVDGGVPWCPFPQDGDGFDQYQGVIK